MSTDMQNNKKLTINGWDKLKGKFLQQRYVIDRIHIWQYVYSFEATCYGTTSNRIILQLERHPVVNNVYEGFVIFQGAINSHKFTQPIDELRDIDIWLERVDVMMGTIIQS